MSTTSSTMTRPSQLQRDVDVDVTIRVAGLDGADLDAADLAEAAEAPASLADISCWRLLTTRVPLTLLIDLALPEAQFNELHQEMLAESSSTDWIPAQRR